VSQKTAEVPQAELVDGKSFPYDGFISYRHSEKQTRIVSAIQEALHRFAKPFWKLRALRLYRDESNLSARPDLWGEIVEALDQSRYFLLVASPEAAESKWVKRETKHWLDRRGERNLIILLTDGQIAWDDARQQFNAAGSSAIPRPLLTHFKTEPLYVDLRWAGEPHAQLEMSNPSFADAVATIAAELHGKSKDELTGIDVQEHRRWRWVRNIGVMAISLLAVGMTIAAYYWYEERNRAIAEEGIVVAHSLAAQAESLLVQRGSLLESAGLYAVESVKRAPSLAGDRAIRKVLALLPKRVAEMNCAAGGKVKSKAFSPDGRYLATAGSDGSPRIWDTGSGQLLAELPTGPVEMMKFSPARHHIVALNAGVASIWDFDPTRRIATLGQSDVRDAEYSPEGAFLVSVGSDKTTRIWDGSLYDEVATLANAQAMTSVAVAPRADEIIASNINIAEVFSSPGPPKQTIETGTPTRFQYSRNGAYLSEVMPNRYLATLMDTALRESLLYLDRHWSAAFSRDGTVAALASPEWDAIAYDLPSCSKAGVKWVPGPGAVMHPVDVAGRSSCRPLGKIHHDDSIVSIVVNADGSLLGTTSRDGTARVWDSYRGREVLRLVEETQGKIEELSFSADGKLVTGFGPNTCRTWISTGFRQVAALPADDAVTDVAFSPDGSRMATINAGVMTRAEVAARVWTVPEGRDAGSVTSGGLGRHSVALGQDGKTVMIDNRDIRNTSTGAVIAAMPKISDGALSAVSRSSNLVAIVTKDNDLVVINRVDGEREIARKTHVTGPITALAFSPDECCLVIAGERKALVWRWKTGEEFVLSEPTSKVVKAAFDGAGKSLALVGGEQSNVIQVFDAATGHQNFSPLRHDAEITGIAFSPDGAHLATSSGDRRVRIWKLSDREQVAEFEHDDTVLAVAFSPDGKYVLSGGGRSDRTGRLWLWRPGDLVREACSRLVRKRLTADEWKQTIGLTEPLLATCPEEATP
jgi:WD40 repeat protein